MLEKFFGRKSTAIVHIVTASVILLALAGYAVMYMRDTSQSPMGLIGYALFCAIALSIMSAPVLLQKKFKLYVPAFIEILLCVFIALYLLSDLLELGRTQTYQSVLPAFGGAVIAMSAFSVIYSLWAWHAEKKGKEPNGILAGVSAFGTTALVVFGWQLIKFLIEMVLFNYDSELLVEYLTYGLSFYGGAIVFCIIGAVQVHFENAERYRIRSFKNIDKAKNKAVENKNKGFYKVVTNNEKDDINYKKIYLSAKSKFLLGKILYYGLYAGYLVYLVIYYFKADRVLNLALIISLIAVFALNIIISIYDYMLFRKKTVTRTLLRLKIAKSAVKILSIGLTLALMLQADAARSELTVITSAVMVVVNIVTFITNFRKDAKHPGKKDNALNTNGAIAVNMEAASDDKI